jgi:hypothetical protein
MIGQYLPNNNEKSYGAVLQKNLEPNRPIALVQNHLLKNWKNSDYN